MAAGDQLQRPLQEAQELLVDIGPTGLDTLPSALSVIGQSLDVLVDNRREQVGLVGEVPVERTHGHAGCPSDLPHGNVCALLGDQLLGCLQDGGPVAHRISTPYQALRHHTARLRHRPAPIDRTKGHPSHSSPFPQACPIPCRAFHLHKHESTFTIVPERRFMLTRGHLRR